VGRVKGSGKVKGSGNASTELRRVAIFRALGVTSWRRVAIIGAAAGRSTKALRASATSKALPIAERGTRFATVRPARLPFRVRPDFVFPKLRIAVFVDGCFWHGCPLHATQPKQNAEFWSRKIAANQTRDRLVTRQLRARGWRVLRLWEHELTKKHERRLLARLRRAGLTLASAL